MADTERDRSALALTCVRCGVFLPPASTSAICEVCAARADVIEEQHRAKVVVRIARLAIANAAVVIPLAFVPYLGFLVVSPTIALCIRLRENLREASPFLNHALGERTKFVRLVSWLAPSCASLALVISVWRIWPELAHIQWHLLWSDLGS